MELVAPTSNMRSLLERKIVSQAEASLLSPDGLSATIGRTVHQGPKNHEGTWRQCMVKMAGAGSRHLLQMR